ncbi:MAG TPA: protein kinase [Blastocatellia bacterium]|nr:protein kinase [Blastocatellia bacterium]
MSPTGEVISHYRIVRKLGAGGMGEVYLAEDTRLDRRVALKLLPEAFTQDQERLRRFTQEAKAASALNHPNIITIHDIGQADSTHFIATEYIEGETLRAHLRRAPLSLSEALDVAVQVAGALAAAHQAGIIHRDIKPENVMRRPDGIVKVLDFGLAKLTESKPLSTDTTAPTIAKADTDPGTIMGTVNYMSPEQARGKPVDARSDIFSLGVLVYEIIAGCPPFEGETPSDLIAAILKSEPPPLVMHSGDVPPELDRIVSKALAKDKEERYQTAKDLLIDLKRLRRQIEVDAELGRSVSPETVKKPTLATGGGAAAATLSQAVAQSSQAALRPTSSAEYIVTGITRHKVAVLILLVVLAAAIVGLMRYWHASNTEVAIESIAVLPFDNLSHDPDADYLSDGVTESIINHLTQLPSLRVIARSTVFRYKGKASDPMAVGKELGVRAVLTGRLLQRGDHLIISAELVDVRDNKQVWGEQYSRNLADALAVQQEISREITDRLRLQLSGAEQTRIAKRDTRNSEAYQLYLRGRYYWNKRTLDGLNQALDYFRQATVTDPNYALAYAGLADCYNLLTELGGPPADQTFPKAKEAATKALLLDDDLAEAHTSLASCLMNDMDWPATEKEFKRALELNPNYATAHQWYGEYLAAVGRLDEALSESVKAQQLDPLSLPINVRLGMTLYFQREYDRAITQLQKTVELDPGYLLPHIFLSFAYIQKGKYDQAIAEKAWALARGNQPKAEGIANRLKAAYKAGGEQRLWLEQINILTDESNDSPVELMWMAESFIRLGQKDRAFEWLTRAVDARHPGRYSLKVEPMLDPLRSDPRFRALLARAGLPQ